MYRALLPLALLLACRKPAVEKAAPEQAAPAVDPHLALRDQARLVLESRCGSCHISSYPTAAPPALAVFDLLDADWSRKMSATQLRSALERVKSGGGDVEMPSATSTQTQIFARYVEAELARRGSAR